MRTRRSKSKAGWSSLFEVVPPLIFAAALSGLIGYCAAWLISYLFPRGAVPEYLKVPVLFSMVIAVFVVSNMIEHEAGLVAVGPASRQTPLHPLPPGAGVWTLAPVSQSRASRPRRSGFRSSTRKK